MSFHDAYIHMNPTDEEKMTFITKNVTFCYKVMPFDLKNALMSYQRLVNKMFEGLLKKHIGIYG